MSINATISQSGNIAISNTPKPQTAREVVADNVKLLIEELESGHSESLTAYLTAMARFRAYSFSNCLEIARQCPSASRVAGMYAWNQLGRRVAKGSKGIRILAPVIGVRRKKDEEAEKDITKQNERVLVGFRNAYLFDISMTTGEGLAELPRVTGSAGEYRERVIDFLIGRGIKLEFSESIAPALGLSYGGKIVILPGQSPAEELATLLHEAAHELLVHSTRRTTTTKAVRETEAEAVAFVVGTAIGLDNRGFSSSYIALYHGNAALLAESLEAVKQVSGTILDAIETPAETETDADASAAEPLAKAS